MSGIELIAAERQRQQAVEGWTLVHDDEHGDGDLALQAGVLALYPTDAIVHHPDYCEGILVDPWGLIQKHANNRVRQLSIAGALIAAELDRLHRLPCRRCGRLLSGHRASQAGPLCYPDTEPTGSSVFIP